MKKLSILIPQYKEDENIIKYLLNSIQSQIDVDFQNDIEVIIVNDGSDIILSQQFLDKYDFGIQYYINKNNMGPSTTRNIALEQSTAEYVCFCDADDMFLVNDAFKNVFKIFNDTQCDLLYSQFFVEDKQGNFYLKDKDNTFCHGKFVQRNFLLENDISWCDKLKVHEDSYFWGLCRTQSKNFQRLEKPIYVYRCNKNSISRQENFLLRTYKDYIISRQSLTEELLFRGYFEPAQKYALTGLYQIYYTLNEDRWLKPENNSYRIETEQMASKYWEKLHYLIDQCNEKDAINLFQKEKEKFLLQTHNSVIQENFTLQDFKIRLENIAKELNKIEKNKYFNYSI